MRKKILMVIGVAALMAAILSLSAFAADATGTAHLTDYGVVTVLLEKLTLNIKALFNVLDAVYTFFSKLFG